MKLKKNYMSAFSHHTFVVSQFVVSVVTDEGDGQNEK